MLYVKGEKAMLTLFCIFLMIGIFGRMIGLAFRMTWGVAKVALFLVFLPLMLVGLLIGGLVYIALPALIIIGVISLIVSLTRTV